MRLSQQSIIKSNNIYYKDILELCRKSKNLYNATLYEIRQHFFTNKKYLSYPSIDKKFKETNNPDYRSLPSQTAQQTMRAVDSMFRSFFGSLNKKRSGDYNKKISIPHSSFINMLSYKCRLKGIRVVIVDEAYTSKSSFLDRDPIPNLKDKNISSFSGKREKRGMYISKDGKMINADVNGSFNIMRKEVCDVEILADRGFVPNPIRLSF